MRCDYQRVVVGRRSHSLNVGRGDGSEGEGGAVIRDGWFRTSSLRVPRANTGTIFKEFGSQKSQSVCQCSSASTVLGCRKL